MPLDNIYWSLNYWLMFHIRIPNSKYSPNPNHNSNPNSYHNAFFLEITADFNLEFYDR